MPEALPAVTVPSFWNAGLSAPSFSAVVPGRGYSSRDTTTGSPFFCGIVTATISSAYHPPSSAAPARRWLSAAKASCAARVMPYLAATASAVVPM